MRRNEVWWADLQEPIGSGPGYRRPVLVVQSDYFNTSGIQTVLIAVLSGNLRLGKLPGNVLIPAQLTGLKLDSVVNVSQVLSIDRDLLTEFVGTDPATGNGSRGCGPPDGSGDIGQVLKNPGSLQRV